MEEIPGIKHDTTRICSLNKLTPMGAKLLIKFMGHKSLVRQVYVKSFNVLKTFVR